MRLVWVNLQKILAIEIGLVLGMFPWGTGAYCKIFLLESLLESDKYRGGF